MDAVASVSKNNVENLSNGYAEILFARGMQALRELKHDESEKSKHRHATHAISTFFEYLYQLRKYGLNDWHEEDAINNIHIAQKLGNVNHQQMLEIIEHIASRAEEASYRDALIYTQKRVKISF